MMNMGVVDVKKGRPATWPFEERLSDFCHRDSTRHPPHIMGIKGLTGLISEHAPDAIKEHEIKTLFGRKVAIDASMSIYQFLIAVRQRDGEQLQNADGETTSHLMGFFYRTIRIAENGIKPAYVFDGKPPEMKKGVVSSFPERVISLDSYMFSCRNVLRNVQRPRRVARKQKKLGPLRKWTSFRDEQSG